MSKRTSLLGLDVGGARIGVAIGDDDVRIAVPQTHIEVDGGELDSVKKLVTDNNVDRIIVGYPRNQSGDPTAQTAIVEAFAETLKSIGVDISFQDESLTSVIAEQRLAARGGAYSKGDIDSEAAAIILQDYMEQSL